MGDQPKCELCGEPMPPGEEMFKFHGYSGNCPKPPLPKKPVGAGEQAVVDCPAPLSYEEAKWFHGGFLAGATAYAAAAGHSTLKSENEKLCEVFDVQGRKTIEACERTPPMPSHLEQRIAGWLRANEKTPGQVRHGTFPLGMVQGWIERAEKAEAFKAWVHQYLDAHGVPHHPPGVHGAEGCRIGDRMDWLMAKLAAAEAASST